MPSLMNGNGATATKMGREYWRSLDDFAGSAEFQRYVENEFPSLLDEVVTPGNRRSFLKLMGASMALAGAGLSGCRRWPDEKIAPFAHRPKDYIPGESMTFATSTDRGGVGYGLIARSYDGRPVKVEGNSNDPILKGSSDAYLQASILEFYDPERSREVVHRTFDAQGAQASASFSTMDEFRAAAASLFTDLKARKGIGLAILAQADSSPSYRAMRAKVAAALPQASWHEYESLSRDNEIEGSRMSLGGAYRAQYSLEKADVVVCLDSDLLVSHPAAAKHAREFAARRRVIDRSMPRLYAVEGVLSLTGANADHRLAVKSGDVASIAVAIAARLANHGVQVLGAEAAGNPSLGAEEGKFVDAVAADLASASTHGRNSLVVAGPRQPAEVHALCHAVNFALQNVGRTVNFTADPDADRPSHVDSIASFVNACAGNRVATVLLLGGNPVYDAPADLGFAAALARVKNRIHLSLYDNETSALCDWHVNAAHFLESWGDSTCWDGTIVLRQPLIEPLYGGLTSVEMLALVLGEGPTIAYELTRSHFKGELGEAGFEQAWRQALHDGVIGSPSPFESARLTAAAWPEALAQRTAAKAAGVEVVFLQAPGVYDGRYANSGWLQELPDPIGKICWDNAAFMSLATAQSITGGPVAGDDLISVGIAGQTQPVTLAVHIVPGMAPGVIGVSVGYGRTRAGHIGDGVGFDVGPIRASGGMGFVGGATVSSAGGHYPLATTQDHHAMDARTTREGLQQRLPIIIRETTLDQFLDNIEHGHGAFHDPARHEHDLPIVSLWEQPAYDGPHRWAMAIDLQACIGCSSCMIACQAENNVPVVGKDQVRRGREMHWLRIDRYFKGPDTARPEVVFQPVACQHCETAPCEQVCPVAATTHDREGLNVMVYNRCVGTRYCSNNCPYKVRRFNFYDWHVSNPRGEGLKPPVLDIPDAAHDKAFTGGNDVKKMGFNPDVTVRMRGVMEKCTFCVQRINQAKIDAKNDWAAAGGTASGSSRYAIVDGTVMPACAQACPTHAIAFGDLNDSQSEVSRLHRDRRTYSLLDELNTRPRNKFLGKVRNYSAALGAAATPAGGEHAADPAADHAEAGH